MQVLFPEEKMLATPRVARVCRMRHNLHRRTSIILLLGLLLSRNCLVCRARSIERPACDGIKWRAGPFDTGHIRAAAISRS